MCWVTIGSGDGLLSILTPVLLFQVMTPQKLGDIYVYVQPEQSLQDYDVPPSRYFPHDGATGTVPVKSKSLDYGVRMLSISPNVSFNDDTLNSSASNLSLPQDTYDVPPSHNSSFDTSNMPHSNRSSTHSMLSTGSTATMSSSLSNQSLPHGSGAGSSCGSTRSSLDIGTQEIYDIPPPARGVFSTPVRSEDSVDGCSELNITGSDMEIYDTPPCSRAVVPDGDDSSLHLPGPDDLYDIPPSARRGHSSFSEASLPDTDEVYDTPPPPRPNSTEHVIDELYDVPPSGAKPCLADKSGRPAAGAQEDGVYDIPPQVTRDSEGLLDDTVSRLSSCSLDSRGSDLPSIPYSELALDLDAAMERLVKLQQDVASSSMKLLSFVSSTWRQRDQLEPKVYEIKISCNKVLTCFSEFVEFSQGTLANSARAEDKKLVQKLIKHLEPLEDSLKQMTKCLGALEEAKWAIDRLVLVDSTKVDGCDDLGLIAEMVKEVPNNVRVMASLIQGNSTLLFRRAEMIDERLKDGPLTSTPTKSGPPTALKLPARVRKDSIQERPLPPVPKPKPRPLSKVEGGTAIYEVPKEKDGTPYDQKDQAIIDDYDYVHLENRPKGVKKEENCYDMNSTGQNDIARTSIGLSSKFKERLEEVQGNQRAHHRSSSTTRVRSMLHDNDKQLLVFYAAQMQQQNSLLVTSADTFFHCIEYSQPPKVFVAHSKFVILGAHKMVYIGDTLHRNILSEDVRSKIMVCANCLCNSLKYTVIATKNAALQYPGVVAMQEMVDRISDVMRAANELKLVVTQGALL